VAAKVTVSRPNRVLSRSYLSQLEKGAFYASLKIIGKLAEALGVEPAELLKRRAPENGAAKTASHDPSGNI
jgi:transcriptional regulator with XRE-family HTH domain